MDRPHILVAGAGIGGLTAALALARRGIGVTIVEKRTSFGETGAGLQISPNAGRVLEALDLRLQLKRSGVAIDGLEIKRWRDGRPIAAMPMGADDDTPFRTFKRADLHLLLLDAARSMPNIRLIPGRGVNAVDEDRDGISTTLVSENGQSERIRALGIVGADGVWSRLRELTGDMTAPLFTGFEAWRTVIPAAKAARAEVSLHLGPKRHAVHYPVAGGRETNLVIVRAAAEAREGWSRSGDWVVLQQHLAGASPALRQLAESATGWQVWSLFDRAPARMAKGRIALLGDAAHPVLPFMAQGAAMAIEDAGVLARLLAFHLQADGAAGVPVALSHYAQARAQRVARVQSTSRDNERAYHLGFPFSAGRDLVMRHLGPEGMRRRYDWLYHWRDAADPGAA